MGRKVRRVPVSLDSSGVTPLADEDISTILRGADDLIMSGGRSLLARVLKGSKQKAVLEKAVDRSPVYGATRELSIDEITRRIDCSGQGLRCHNLSQNAHGIATCMMSDAPRRRERPHDQLIRRPAHLGFTQGARHRLADTCAPDTRCHDSRRHR
jgi:hypothetical protein